MASFQAADPVAQASYRKPARPAAATPGGRATGTAPAAGLAGPVDFYEGVGNLATDSSGNGHTGQLFGPSWVQQGTGYAISLDGRDDYGDFGSNQNIGIGGTLSLEAWIQPTTKAHGEAVIMGTDLHSYLLTYYNTELTPISTLAAGRTMSVGMSRSTNGIML